MSCPICTRGCYTINSPLAIRLIAKDFPWQELAAVLISLRVSLKCGRRPSWPNESRPPHSLPPPRKLLADDLCAKALTCVALTGLLPSRPGGLKMLVSVHPALESRLAEARERTGVAAKEGRKGAWIPTDAKWREDSGRRDEPPTTPRATITAMVLSEDVVSLKVHNRPFGRPARTGGVEPGPAVNLLRS